MNNKKIAAWLGVIIIIIIGVGFYFCKNGMVSKWFNNKPTVQNTSNWKVCSNKSRGYSFKIPNGWSFIKGTEYDKNFSGEEFCNDSDAKCLISPDPIQWSSNICINPVVLTLGYDVHNNGFNFNSIDELLQSRIKDLSNHAYADRTALTVGGYEAKRLMIENSEGLIWKEEVIFIVNNKFYEIDLNSLVNLFPHFEPTFDTFLTTFSFQNHNN